MSVVPPRSSSSVVVTTARRPSSRRRTARCRRGARAARSRGRRRACPCRGRSACARRNGNAPPTRRSIVADDERPAVAGQHPALEEVRAGVANRTRGCAARRTGASHDLAVAGRGDMCQRFACVIVVPPPLGRAAFFLPPSSPRAAHRAARSCAPSIWRYRSSQSVAAASGFGLEPARPALRVAPARDEPGALEHLEVHRDRGLAHRERLGELVTDGLARGQPRQDRAPGRIGEGGEGGVEPARTPFISDRFHKR